MILLTDKEKEEKCCGKRARSAIMVNAYRKMAEILRSKVGAAVNGRQIVLIRNLLS
jgi:hypothetical protein